MAVQAIGEYLLLDNQYSDIISFFTKELGLNDWNFCRNSNLHYAQRSLRGLGSTQIRLLRQQLKDPSLQRSLRIIRGNNFPVGQSG